MTPPRLRDHKRTLTEFSALLRERTDRLNTDPALRLGFVKEMQRFLPAQTVRETVGKGLCRDYLSAPIQEEAGQALAAAEHSRSGRTSS